MSQKTNKEIIVDFLTQMAKQDNRATAAPFYYVIRTKKKVYLPDGYGSDKLFRCGDEPREFTSEFQAAKALFKDGCSKDRVKELLNEGEWFDYAMEWEHKGMFLTETDAERHLKLNHYHYSKDAHTYVDHAWRAPELSEFLCALFKEYKINPTWK